MRLIPSPDVALRLLRERFFHRTDSVAIWAPWGKPCHVAPASDLEDLLLAHMYGAALPEVQVKFATDRCAKLLHGHFRIGTYTPDVDQLVRWCCVDIDGAGHKSPIADPRGVAISVLHAFSTAGLPAYLESSASGKGWHVWCFFDPPIEAAKARRLTYAMLPASVPLARPGQYADPVQGKGLEIFPKQDLLPARPAPSEPPKAGKGKRPWKRSVGSAVWLPWWSNAAEGGNLFYRPRDGADLEFEPYIPTEFVTADPDVVERAYAQLPEAALHAFSKRRRKAKTHVGAAPSTGTTANRGQSAPSGGSASEAGSVRGPRAPSDSTSVPEPPSAVGDPAAADLGEPWKAWRGRALAALPLESVYGAWLTGKTSGTGWLECRDPDSPSGDENPSAGVADGSGDAARGSFHSFRSGATISVFDFLIARGEAADFRAARDKIAALAGVPVPVPHVAPLGDREPRVGRQPHQPASRRPRILICADEHAVVDEAIAALSRIDGVYCRGPLLVHIVKHAPPLAGIIHAAGGPRIYPLGQGGLRDRLTLAAEWIEIRVTSDGPMEMHAHPPTWAIPEIEARKYFPGMPYLEGVIDSPVLRPDGTLLDRAGYDSATGLYYAPNEQYPSIPESPTQDDAAAAAAELIDLVGDFPFKSDAHRTAWLAAVLTPLARYAFPGPSPLFLMDANVRSAGKSLLTDVVGEIVSGRPMSRSPQAADEAEEIKRITAIAIDGTRLVLIDNINRPLGSGALDAALTSTSWSDRILGKSEKVELPLLTIWYATGNNITFKGDTARRCLHVRLDSDLEKPELRDNFKYPALLAWAHAHRGRYVMAALTILRAYCAAGRPAVPIKPWGSFEGWSNLVRNAIVWAGLSDPGATRAELDDLDADQNILADLIAGWTDLPNQWGTTGCTVARALEALNDDMTSRRYPRLRAALGELCPHASNQLPPARKVGYALRRFRGRVVAGRKLQYRILDGNKLWFVQSVKDDLLKPKDSALTAQLSLVQIEQDHSS